MISLRLQRRIRAFFFSQFFISTLILLSIAVTVYVVFFTDLINKPQPAASEPIITTQELPVMLITVPPEASSSQPLVSQLNLVALGQSFQTVNLFSDGSISQPITESTISAQLTILIADDLPKHEALQNFYHLATLLEANGLRPQYIWAYQDYFALYLSDPLLVAIPAYSPVQVSLDTLHLIRSRSTMDLSGALIDLRFSKPVIAPGQISRIIK